MRRGGEVTNEDRRRGGVDEVGGGPERRGGGVRGGGVRGGDEGAPKACGGESEVDDSGGPEGSPFQRTAPSSTRRSKIWLTCSAGRPVIAWISATLERPSMREKTKPSMAVSGRVRMSTPPTSSGTR